MVARILVIDDSVTIRTLVKLALTKAGYQLQLAETGSEGISLAGANPPDLILLDYMLPDMKGDQVCQELTTGGTAADTPIVLMSAKNENVTEQFSDYNTIKGFVSKPFSADDIISKVKEALNEVPGAAAEPAPAEVGISKGHQERAAKAMYAELRRGFGAIPEWLPHLGTTPPAQFFARKLLTPDSVRRVLEALQPLYSELLEAVPKQDAEPDAPTGEILLQGQLALMPVLGLLKVLAAYGRTGELTLDQRDRRTLVYFRRGKIVLATTTDPDLYKQGAEVQSAPEPTQAALDKAYAGQRDSGKPSYVTLAESGEFPAAELPGLLYEQGKRLLLEAIDLGGGPYASA